MRIHLIALATLMTAFVSCDVAHGVVDKKEDQEEKERKEVSAVNISLENVNLREGEDIQLSASVVPADAYINTITWASTDPEIATVKDGKVHAISAGETTIIAQSDANSTIRAYCNVSIIPILAAANIHLNNACPTDILWGVTLSGNMLYKWKEQEFGVLSYTLPEYYQAHFFDNATKETLTTAVFHSTGGRAAFDTDGKYDLLAYSDGTEKTTFIPANDNSTYIATTEKQDDGFYGQPDEILRAYAGGFTFPQTLGKYDMGKDENGNYIFISEVNAGVKPCTFIYILQVILTENSKITDVLQADVSGLAGETEMISGFNTKKTVSLRLNSFTPMKEYENLDLPGGGRADLAFLSVARFVTFGLPGTDPWGEAAKDNSNIVTLTLADSDGTPYVLDIDISEQMRTKPTGGVINLFIDASAL